MLGIDQGPEKTQHQREDGNQVTKSSHACARRIERRTFLSNDDQLTVLHTGGLAGADHEKEEVDRNKDEEAGAINAGDSAIYCNIVRHLQESRDDKYTVDERHDCKVC